MDRLTQQLIIQLAGGLVELGITAMRSAGATKEQIDAKARSAWQKAQTVIDRANEALGDNT